MKVKNAGSSNVFESARIKSGWTKGSLKDATKEHWELAEYAIAQKDGLATMLLPPVPPQPEPIEAIVNQGEFPTLVDQGEGEAPGGRQ